MFDKSNQRRHTVTWVQPDQLAWVHNLDIFPGKKIYLPVLIKEVINDNKIKVSIKVNDKISTEFNIERQNLFKRSAYEEGDYKREEDISMLQIINRPEIFEYIKQRELMNKFYFFQGIDLIFLNNFNKIVYKENTDELFHENLNSHKDMRMAMEWLSDEKTLKPEKASISLFLADTLKSFMMTFETQVILIMGEHQSGKSIIFRDIVDQLCFYNIDGMVQQSVMNRQRTKTVEKKSMLFNLERISFIKSLNDLNEADFFETIDKDFEVNDRNTSFSLMDIHQNFCDKIKQSLDVLDLFITVIDGDNRNASAAVKVVHLQMNNKFKFIAFQVDVQFMQLRMIEGTYQTNFMILYCVILGLDESELKEFDLKPTLDEYQILSKKVSLKEKQYFQQKISKIKLFLSEQEWKMLLGVVYSILALGNYQKTSIQKPTLKQIAFQLKLEPSLLFSLFSDDKKQKEKISQLMMNLYKTLVQFLEDKINLLTQQEIYHFQEYHALTIVDTFGYNEKSFSGGTENKVNNFYSFYSNYLNEIFISFFNHQRFTKEKKEFEQQGLAGYYKDLSYIDNVKVVGTLNNLINSMIKHEELDGLKNECSQNGIKIKMGSRQALIQSQLGRQTQEVIQLASLQHYFSEEVQYDLNNIFVKSNCSSQINTLIHQLLLSSPLFRDYMEPPLHCPQNSLMKGLQKELEIFLSEINNLSVHFVRTVKLPPSQDQVRLYQDLYSQFNQIDFESQIQRFQVNYPYKLDYKYLIEKFNVITKSIKISPHLNVDYKKIIEQILVNMFGENHEDKFLIGKDKLFMKAPFLIEFDELLKEHERKENSRLLKFIENTLVQQLKEHVDNSNKIVCLARRFLESNAVMSKLQKWKRAVRNVEIKWLQIQSKKISLQIINEILDTLEYYNLKKVIKIQALMRGHLVRKKYKDYVDRIKRAPYRHKILKKDKVMSQKVKVLFDKMDIIKDIEKKILINKTVDYILKVESQLAQNLHRQKMLKKIMPEILVKCSLAIYARKIRFLKKMKRRVDVIILVIRFVKKIKKAVTITRKRNILIQRQEKFKETRIQITGLENKFQVSFDNLNKKPDEVKTKSKSPIKTPVVLKKKLNLKNQLALKIQKINIVSNDVDQESIQGLVKYIKENTDSEKLGDMQQQQEGILLLEKQNSQIRYLKDNKLHSIQTSSKVTKIRPTKNGCVILNDEHQISFQGKQTKKQNDLFETALKSLAQRKVQIYDFECSENFLIASSWKGELLIFRKDEEPQQFDFQRIIKKIGLGTDFMILLDFAGVLYAQGTNERGQLGVGKKINDEQIHTVRSLGKMKELGVDLGVGSSHVFVVTQTNKLFCWGDNRSYQLGSLCENDEDCHFVPVQYNYEEQLKMMGKPKIQIECGSTSTYLLTDDKRLFEMGMVSFGQINYAFKEQDLSSLGQKQYPVRLSVSKGELMECINLLCFENKSELLLKDFNRASKEIFSQFLDCKHNVLPYRDIQSWVLDLGFMRTKAAEQNFQKMYKNIALRSKNF